MNILWGYCSWRGGFSAELRVLRMKGNLGIALGIVHVGGNFGADAAL